MRDGVKAMKYSQTISTEKNNKELIFITICIVALIMSILLGVCLGSTKIPVSDFFKALLDNDGSTNSRIIYAVRLPRVVASVLAGAALAVSGVEIQSILENPLAAPSIIGINSGAGFSAVLAMALFPNKFSLIPTAALRSFSVCTATRQSRRAARACALHRKCSVPACALHFQICYSVLQPPLATLSLLP